MSERLAQLQATAASRHQGLGLVLAALQRGDLTQAQRLIEAQPESGLSLVDAFSHYQIELETQNHELRQAQQRTEALLAWSTQLFRELPVPALVLDTLGLVQDANERASQVLDLGWGPRQRGLPLRRLMATADDEFRLQQVLHLAQTAQHATMGPTQLLGAQGRQLWATLSIVPMQERPGERDQRLMCIVEDHTAQLEAERAREAAALAAQQRDFARATSEANHRMMARVSHEFRTPLNAVIGFSDLMLEKGSRLQTHEAREFLQHIREAGVNLLALVEDVLQVNRIHGHEAPPMAHEALDLHGMAEQVVELLGDLARRAGVQLSLDDQPDDLPQARGHPRRVREVLINLVSNAIKYNQPDGWVRLAFGHMGQYVWVAVSDSGEGMSRPQLEQLFEPFNRLGAEAGNLHGTGLGLVIAKGLVEGMGGRLTVTSTPGVGSCFVAELPLWHGHEGAAR